MLVGSSYLELTLTFALGPIMAAVDTKAPMNINSGLVLWANANACSQSRMLLGTTEDHGSE